MHQPDRPWLVPEPWEIQREKHAEATRLGKLRTPDERREHYNRRHRDWERAQRYGVDAPIVGWLHELACDGNHKGNKRCKPTPCYAVTQ